MTELYQGAMDGLWEMTPGLPIFFVAGGGQGGYEGARGAWRAQKGEGAPGGCAQLRARRSPALLRAPRPLTWRYSDGGTRGVGANGARGVGRPRGGPEVALSDTRAAGGEGLGGPGGCVEGGTECGD